jgi:RND family efflux transporter MFP subunit
LLFLSGSLLSTVVPAKAQTSTPEVVFTRPITQEVTEYLSFTGTVEPTERVELRARVSGYIDRVLFKDGAAVKKGDVLFEIDSRLYQVELERAEGELKKAVARLKRETDALKRLQGREDKPEELERARHEREDAEAGVQVARAGLERAKLTLGFAKVTAPISGRFSRCVGPGNFVKADATPLATIVNFDTVHIHFNAAQDEFTALRKAIPEGKVKTASERSLPVVVNLDDQPGLPHKGHIDFQHSDPKPSEKPFRLRAVVPNPTGILVPGLSVAVRVLTSESYRALLVPEEAVRDEGDQTVLFVINGKSVVERRRVKVGFRQEGLRVVTEGVTAEDQVALGQICLKQGDRVVYSLADLRAGMAVKPREESPEKKGKE